MNTKFKRALASAGLAVMGFSVIPAGAALASGNGTDNISFCHSTSSDSNPYVTLKSDPDGIFTNGHTGHVGPIWTPGATTWGDIIPPFDYSGGHYAGLNWPAGQVLLDNNCNYPKVVPTPTVTATVAPTDPAPTESASPTPTATVVVTDSPTPEPTVTETTSPTPTATVTETVSPTPEVTVTETPTETPSATPTETPSATATATATATETAPVVIPTTEPPFVPVPTVAPTSPAPVVPDKVLPHTGYDADLMLTWSMIGMGVGMGMLYFGLRKPA